MGGGKGFGTGAQRDKRAASSAVAVQEWENRKSANYGMDEGKDEERQIALHRKLTERVGEACWKHGQFEPRPTCP